MKNKKVLIICSIVIIIASISALIYLFVKDDNKPQNNIIEGIKLPENQEILKDKTINNLKITDVSLLTRDGISSYKAWVLNENATDINVNKLYVVFYENEKETKVLVLNDITIKANDKSYINITSETDLSKITKIEYILED